MNRPSSRILINLILNNYQDPDFGLKMILSHIGYRKNHIYDICHYILKMNTIELVRTIRINIAIEEIFNGNDRVWSRVGYSSISVFSKTFKKITGINIRELKSIISTNEIGQNEKLYLELIDNIWKGRYSEFYELAGPKWQERKKK